eukprot:Clim_evm51s77 gene=Clim_evmTU51s77
MTAGAAGDNPEVETSAPMNGQAPSPPFESPGKPFAHPHSHDDVLEAADYLKSKVQGFVPQLGVVLGSGLGPFAEQIRDPIRIEYKDIPHYPVSTVLGHQGQCIFGYIGETRVMCYKGRSHYYEGYDMSQLALPVRVMKQMGVQILLVTNASGALNPNYAAGDIIRISDHLNLPGMMGVNPLIGKHDPQWGARFVNTTEAYNKHLGGIMDECAKECEITDIYRTGGVYCYLTGPTYESRAEARLLRGFGGDCVGMSTVPEVIVAHQSGIRVVTLSLATNEVQHDENDNSPEVTHQDVIKMGEERSHVMMRLVERFVHKAGAEMV